VNHPLVLGLAITLYDPSLDQDRVCATRLVTLIETALAAG
jgi:hypothetical protein